MSPLPPLINVCIIPQGPRPPRHLPSPHPSSHEDRVPPPPPTPAHIVPRQRVPGAGATGADGGRACSERLTLRQGQVDKLYASLKDLAEERRAALQEHQRLCQLKRDVDDLEQWISEREVVAASHELGQDYEHVTVRGWTGQEGAGVPPCPLPAVPDTARPLPADAAGQVQGVLAGHQQHRAGAGGRRQRAGGHADRGGALGERHGGRVEGRAERGLGRPAGADRHAVADAGGLLRAAPVLPRRPRDPGPGAAQAEAAAGRGGPRPEHGRSHAAHAHRLRARHPGPQHPGEPLGAAGMVRHGADRDGGAACHETARREAARRSAMWDGAALRCGTPQRGPAWCSVGWHRAA